jgi:hypothetical protein
MAVAFSQVHSAAPPTASVPAPLDEGALVTHTEWYFGPSLATTALPPGSDTISHGPTELSHVPKASALAIRGITRRARLTALSRLRMLTSVGNAHNVLVHDTPAGPAWAAGAPTPPNKELKLTKPGQLRSFEA